LETNVLMYYKNAEIDLVYINISDNPLKQYLIHSIIKRYFGHTAMLPDKPINKSIDAHNYHLIIQLTTLCVNHY